MQNTVKECTQNVFQLDKLKNSKNYQKFLEGIPELSKCEISSKYKKENIAFFLNLY